MINRLLIIWSNFSTYFSIYFVYSKNSAKNWITLLNELLYRMNYFIKWEETIISVKIDDWKYVVKCYVTSDYFCKILRWFSFFFSNMNFSLQSNSCLNMSNFWLKILFLFHHTKFFDEINQEMIWQPLRINDVENFHLTLLLLFPVCKKNG